MVGAFRDNADDAAWIIQNMEVIGIALAKGILAYFGIAYIPPKPIEPQPSSRIYRIQVGAYTQETNAKAMLAKLKLAGLYMSQEQFQNELNYRLSVKFIQKMLVKGLITEDEFKKIDRLNRISFSPKLAAIMA